MIICFNCRRETKKDMDRLIEAGQYRDYSEIISIAVANLTLLQSEMANEGVLIINDGDKQTVKRESVPSPRQSEKQTRTLKRKQKSIAQATPETLGIPTIFRLDGNEKAPSTFAPVSSEKWESEDRVPLDHWLFGQYNKILPVKASCRALAHLIADYPDGVPLDLATERIASEATALGDYLTGYDLKHSIPRDDAHTIAFPRSGKDSEKSRSRYASQFIASVNSHGQISGLLYEYKFINHTGGGAPALNLTESGWNFAAMPNPVLDSLQDKPTKKLCEEEIAFLLEHIARVVPVEDFAFRSIISAIREGANTPDALDATLQTLVSKDTNRSLSKSFLSSQRSGAISRMADLGLLARLRKGIRVSYVITEAGSKYVQNAQTHWERKV